MSMSQETPAPVASINEWSCAIACIEWVCKRHGKDIDQNQILKDFKNHFPRWKDQAGLMQAQDIPILISLLKFSGVTSHGCGTKDETVKVITDHYTKYFAGFVLTSKPTNHCLAIYEWDGDRVSLMEPDQMQPIYSQYKWDELFDKRGASVLWLFR